MSGPENTRDFDQFVKGMCHAFNEVLDMKPEVTIEERQDDSEV